MRRDCEEIIIAGALKAIATPGAVVLQQNLSVRWLASSFHLQVILHELSDRNSLPSAIRTPSRRGFLRVIGFAFVKAAVLIR
jgi:hypothetical protein